MRPDIECQLKKAKGFGLPVGPSDSSAVETQATELGLTKRQVEKSSLIVPGVISRRLGPIIPAAHSPSPSELVLQMRIEPHARDRRESAQVAFVPKDFRFPEQGTVYGASGIFPPEGKIQPV